MNYHEIVQEHARRLGLLATDGALHKLDSLGMIDLIVALEDATGVEVPMASLREECFESVDTIADLLEQFADG